MSLWPDGLTGACLMSGPEVSGGKTGGRQRSLLRVLGTSLLVKGKTENSRLRIFSVLRVLPAATHFLRRSARLVWRRPALSRASSRRRKPRGCWSLPCQSFLVTAKVELALGQAGVGVEAEVEIPLEGLDEFFAPAGEELVLEGLHGGIVPKPALGRVLAELADSGKVRCGQQDEGVVGEQMLRGRNGRLGGEGGDQRAQPQPSGETTKYAKHTNKDHSSRRFCPMRLGGSR